MYFWLNFIIGGVLYIYAMAFLWGFMLTPRWPKVPLWIPATAFVLADMIPGFVRISDADGPLFHLMGYSQMLIIFLYLAIVFRDKWWKKLISFTLYLVMAHIAEFIALPIVTSMGLAYNYDFNSYDVFVFQTLTCMMSVCLASVVVLVWNFATKRQRPPQNVWVIVLFPLSQMLLIWNLNDVMLFHMPILGEQMIAAVGFMLSFAADLALFYVLMRQGERDTLAQQVRDLEHLRQTELLHYQSMEARREEMAKIRHDFNNHLTTALYLTEQGALSDSHKLLNQLKDCITVTKESAWCANPVVNAVLDEKVAVCQQQGITLQTELNLDQNLNIQPVHLCSAFSNLLDNAIHGAAKVPEAQRAISLHALRDGDFLHIKTKNPSPSPERKRRADGHGYGQQILRDIAQQYDGSFQAEWRDGVYTAVLSLSLAVSCVQI